MTVAVRERPILFSGPMVRAILAGQKTQTRRVLMAWRGRAWVEPDAHATTLNFDRREISFEYSGLAYWTGPISFPYGQPGDRLWVRETWGEHILDVGDVRQDRWFVYRADNNGRPSDNGGDMPWRPSIHMPRWASRITLEITDVRVERLQDISEADIIAEGCTVDRVAELTGVHWGDMPTLHHAWRIGWDHLNASRGYSWQSNPWVWAITFKVVTA